MFICQRKRVVTNLAQNWRSTTANKDLTVVCTDRTYSIVSLNLKYLYINFYGKKMVLDDQNKLMHTVI